MSSNEIFSSLEEDAKKQREIPTDEKLSKLTSICRRLVNKEREYSDYKSLASKSYEELKDIREKEIPDAMMSLNISKFVMDDGTEIAVKDELYASINESKRKEALEWLDNNGLGDIIKHDITISFARGEHEEAERIKGVLQDNGQDSYLEKATVHPQTLKATFKDLRNKGEEIPDGLFNWYETPLAKVKLSKGEK
jgi:hypothetical protein|tara:strand:- start:2085 stop:2669 length:585 start_codon:yes stop_codon:yes gene_type:complete